MVQDPDMAGWESKDDLELTAEDIAGMLAGGVPVEIDTLLPHVVSLNWVGDVGFRVAPGTFGTALGRPRMLARQESVRGVVSAGSDGGLATVQN